MEQDTKTQVTRYIGNKEGKKELIPSSLCSLYHSCLIRQCQRQYNEFSEQHKTRIIGIVQLYKRAKLHKAYHL